MIASQLFVVPTAQLLQGAGIVVVANRRRQKCWYSTFTQKWVKNGRSGKLCSVGCHGKATQKTVELWKREKGAADKDSFIVFVFYYKCG